MHARNPERGPEEPLLSLVFPTYNPGASLERTWTAVSEFVRAAPGKWEVLFVCDGCSDGSPRRLAELARRDPEHFRVLSYATNRGKGYAVRYGLAAARGQWRVFTDFDLAYGFEDIARLADALRGGAEVAIASRLHADSRLIVPPRLQGYAYRRHLQSLAFSAVVRLLLPLAQRDTQAGLKGLSARAAERLLPLLRCDGFGFDCELLTACVRLGLEVSEVPVCVRYESAASTTGMQTISRMMRELWAIRRTWRGIPEPLTAGTHGGRQAA